MNAYGNEAYTFTENRFTNQCNNQFDKNSAVVGNGIPFDRRNYDESSPGARFDFDREEMDNMYVMESRPDLPYKQHAFKEYVPYVYPRTMRIRFDKIDSSLADTFSVFEPNIFTTVERILHEGRQRYSTCPQFDMSLVHQLNGVGCLVRASVDSGCRSLCRAEIIKFANSTNRFSVYLVDYGFYKWIKFSDVFDISVINKRDKILYLPVALFHCRLEKCASGIRLQHLEKGGEYEITIKSRDSEGIFNVHIDRIDDDEDTLTNTRDSLVSFNFDGYTPGQSLIYTSYYDENKLDSITRKQIEYECPILVIDAGEEQREVAAQISGRECRCINGNLVVIPSVGLCVKGRLLVSYGNGGYAELKDISLVPADGQDCSKFVMEGMFAH
ncbi:hypothetical protein WUBG_11130, partial [Wuchereria bancrofti]